MTVHSDTHEVDPGLPVIGFRRLRVEDRGGHLLTVSSPESHHEWTGPQARTTPPGENDGNGIHASYDLAGTDFYRRPTTVVLTTAPDGTIAVRAVTCYLATALTAPPDRVMLGTAGFRTAAAAVTFVADPGDVRELLCDPATDAFLDGHAVDGQSVVRSGRVTVAGFEDSTAARLRSAWGIRVAREEWLDVRAAEYGDRLSATDYLKPLTVWLRGESTPVGSMPVDDQRSLALLLPELATHHPVLAREVAAALITVDSFPVRHDLLAVLPRLWRHDCELAATVTDALSHAPGLHLRSSLIRQLPQLVEHGAAIEPAVIRAWASAPDVRIAFMSILPWLWDRHPTLAGDLAATVVAPGGRHHDRAELARQLPQVWDRDPEAARSLALRLVALGDPAVLAATVARLDRWWERSPHLARSMTARCARARTPLVEAPLVQYLPSLWRHDPTLGRTVFDGLARTRAQPTCDALARTIPLIPTDSPLHLDPRPRRRGLDALTHRRPARALV